MILPDDFLFAAAYHDVIPVRGINKIRLNPYDIEAYYNSGVLLMNLKLQRMVINERIFSILLRRTAIS